MTCMYKWLFCMVESIFRGVSTTNSVCLRMPMPTVAKSLRQIFRGYAYRLLNATTPAGGSFALRPTHSRYRMLSGWDVRSSSGGAGGAWEGEEERGLGDGMGVVGVLLGLGRAAGGRKRDGMRGEMKQPLEERNNGSIPVFLAR